MLNHAAEDPYAGNILVAPLGPILSPQQVLQRLTLLPPLPPDPSSIPKHIRLHHLMRIRDLHLPTREELRMQESIDLSIRQGLRYRDPGSAQTWASISGDSALIEAYPIQAASQMPATAVTAVGPSGVGKTQSVLQILRRCYPGQVILHPSFPRIAGKHVQVVWLSVDIPGSGRTDDLAEALMKEWDSTLGRSLQGYSPRFEHTLSLQKRKGSRMLEEWRQVASSHFLGILHLDEIQNLFRIESLRTRRSSKAPTDQIELSLVEDESLKWILTMTNTWQIPLFLTGTADGIGALTKRLATMQRIGSSGYHRFEPFSGPDDPAFRQFMDTLGRYQYMKKQIDVGELLEVVFRLTAGIRRLIIALWIGAHRIAFERREDELRLSDFVTASQTLLALVAPAVKALLSGEPDSIQRYEDLRPGDAFWETYWPSVQQPSIDT